MTSSNDGTQAPATYDIRPMNADVEREAEGLFHELADAPASLREGRLRAAAPDVRGRVQRLLELHDASCDPGLRTPAFTRLNPARDSSAWPAPKSIGPYTILKTLGEGGMGVVYLAEQITPIHRQVALKVIKLGMDTKAVMARFEAEREALALMNHPNVARVLDAGATEQGRPYFVMEYVEGVPMTHFCDRQRLALVERLNLFMQVCHAVQHAHQKGIIHRDLKPSNVLVTLVDGHAAVKVIDFGIAKATQQKLTEQTFATEQGILIGTPAYMAPEQADPVGLDIDTRADVYSLGVILYELLVGALPLDPDTMRGAALSEIQRMLREVDPPRPSSRLTSVPVGEAAASPRAIRRILPQTVAERRRTDTKSLVRLVRGDLDWIVMKCLEKDRSRRYDTANALVTDVQRYLNHESVLAGPPSRMYRMRKFIRRNRVPVTAAALVGLTLVGGLVGTSVMFLRATAAEARERTERIRAEDGETFAENARVRAEQALEEAEQVTRFLTDMLAAVGPWEQGLEVTVRQVLDQAAAGIGDRFAHKPLVEARLQQTLGQTYSELGLFDLARKHITLAAATYGKELGPQDPRTLSAVNVLAEVLKDQGHFSEAEASLRSTLEIQRLVRGEEHPETLRSMLFLAVTLGRQGRYAEAEDMYRRTLDGRLRVLGEEHLDTQSCNEGLGITLSQQGKYVEGEQYFRKALETLRRFVRPDHPDVLGVMGNLAINLGLQGRLDEAEQLLRETLELKRRVLGPDNSDTIATMQELANNLYRQGRYAESEALFRTTVEELSRILNPDHDQTLGSLASLAATLHAEGRYAEAEAMFRKTLEARRPILGPEHPKTLDTVFGLAACLKDQGRYVEADQMYRSTLDNARRVLGDDHPSTLTYMNGLAESLVNQARYTEAEELQRSAVNAARRTLSPGHPETLTYLHSLASNLANQGEYAEAETLFRETIDARRRILGNDHPDLAQSLDGLAAVLLKSNRALDAEVLCAEAAPILAACLPKEHRASQLNANLLGAILCALGHYREAEPLLVQSYEALRDDPGLPPNVRRESLDRLVRLYDDWHAVEPTANHNTRAAAWRDQMESLISPRN